MNGHCDLSTTTGVNPRQARIPGAATSLTLRVSIARKPSMDTNPKRERGIWGRSPLKHPFTGREGAAEGGSMG